MQLDDSEKIELCVLKRIKDKKDKATAWEVVTRLSDKEGIAQLQIRRCLDNFRTTGCVLKEKGGIYKLTEKGKEYLDALISKSN
jgi:hypothetical protein